MNTVKLKDLSINALNDLKANDLVILDIHSLTTIADVMIICSGRSTQHVKSLAENVVKEAKKHHVKYLHLEGEREGEWVIVDLADVIVHVMLPSIREFYRLEDLWEPVQTLREKHH